MALTNRVQLVVGVAGGSGSGKTTFVRALQNAIGAENCSILSQDSYYFDAVKEFDFDGGAINFDHPNSLEFPLLLNHICALKAGESISVPSYCFKTHARVGMTTLAANKPVLLVDGILLLSQPALCAHFDISVFVDVPEQIRFQRRLHRDVRERGRSPEGVTAQFHSQVKPMHDQFVAPSLRFANVVCDGTSPVEESVLRVLDEMRALLSFQQLEDTCWFPKDCNESDRFDLHDRPTLVTNHLAY